nr:hypothetical protein TEA_019755 [Ipomoea batatas]
MVTKTVMPKQIAKMKLTPPQSFLTPPRRRARSSTPIDMKPKTTELSMSPSAPACTPRERIHMGLGRSFKAPKISPKNGTPFPFCAFSPPSAASFSSCSFTKVSAMVVTVSKRATEMKKQLLRLAHDVEDPKPDDKNSNGTGLSGFVEAVAGGVADISGEANEEDSENDEQGAGSNKGATATETPSAIVAVVADQGLNNHAGDGPTKPHKGREFVRDSEQLNVRGEEGELQGPPELNSRRNGRHHYYLPYRRRRLLLRLLHLQGGFSVNGVSLHIYIFH